MYYFSYGSNMSIKHLLDRIASADKVDVGILEMHELKFHKVSKIDGSAKCDVSETGRSEHIVYGVVFLVPEKEKPELDKIEGLGYGYEQKDVEVILNNGSTIEAFTYYATNIDPELKPLDWYKEHVLRGAREISYQLNTFVVLKQLSLMKIMMLGDAIKSYQYTANKLFKSMGAKHLRCF